MSLIIHRCDVCGHRDIDHRVTADKHGACYTPRCSCRKPKYGPSEVIPAYSNATGEETPIARPGSIDPGTNIRTCDCIGCTELYEQVTQ